MTKTRKMTLKQITDTLAAAGIDDPRSEALVLAEAFTGSSRARLLCEPGADICSSSLEDAVRRRASRQPLQYILGKWEFMGLPFQVSTDCLIPRSDTELLCELAIRRLPWGGTVMDLCTGSGCVAVAVAHYRPDARVVAVEKFPNTLQCAKENARLAEVDGRIEFIPGDVTDREEMLSTFGGRRFDMILSNPPYVTLREMEEVMPELKWEPAAALTDGGDGLSFYRAMTDIFPKFLTDSGIMAYEHGFAQGAAVRDIIRLAGYGAVTLRDLSGNDRVTFFEKQNTIK